MKKYFCMRVSGNTTGSHSTIYPSGTHACRLVHEDGSDDPANYVEVEELNQQQWLELKKAGKLHFSTNDDFLDWLSE
jgi:hypothetical protein